MQNPWYLSGCRLKAIVGHFGSGKTEIAMNAAIAAHSHGLSAAVVDLDIVNPFFRSAEKKEELAALGVETFYPTYALSPVDIPALPAEITAVFHRQDLRVFFDVGGDDAGAAALGTYYPQFQRHGLDIYYVINPFRPRSSTRELILELMDKVQQRARSPICGLINNANVGDYTDEATLSRGRELIGEISVETGIPVVAEYALAHLGGGDGFLPRYPLERILKPEWMEH